MFLMNNFQSEKNGAEVVAASDSNPVRVASFLAIAAGEFERSLSRRPPWRPETGEANPVRVARLASDPQASHPPQAH
jgi:hypothetical protein